MRRAGAMVAALPALFVAAGCGEETVNADRAAETVDDFVTEGTGFEPTDVECPEDVEAKVGETFECTFTGPEGPYTAEVRITEIDGDDAQFDIRTHPTS